MLVLETRKLELRGIQSKVSLKTGKPYYIVCCEDFESVDRTDFLCKDYNVLPQGLKKGDHVKLTVSYNNFKEFDVLKVEKVTA